MKLCAIIAGAVYATTATAWKIDWYYVNGQHVTSNGRATSSGCVNLNIQSVDLNRYDVDFTTTLVRDPNRVRLWTGTGCAGTPTWDSGRERSNDLIPNRRVRSYKIDHD